MRLPVRFPLPVPPPARRGRSRTSRVRALLATGVAAGPLFVSAFAVQGALRAHYDGRRHPVSSLALGPYGRVQTANFLTTGALTLALAEGLRRTPGHGSTWGPRLVAGWGVGLLGAGAFVTDPVGDYPPGAPQDPDITVPGGLHDAFSLLAFGSLIAAEASYARACRASGEHGWAAGSAAAATVTAATFLYSGWAFGRPDAPGRRAGLAQRTSITTGCAWLTLLALRTLKTTR
ncbi:DUF998 domain-containing protein [Streptomyces sp. NPDC048057]|uniref:DUF998 domain-containing protein n=1 Tax=Streptomyces sp. NPDC048057 TaxID=3155628 RepID=UPI0034106B3E